MKGVGPEPGVNRCFSSAQWPSPTCRGQDWVPNCCNRTSKDWIWTGSISFKCVLSLLPALATWPQRGAVLEREGLVCALSMGCGVGCGGPARSETWTLLMAACVNASDDFPCSAQMPLQVWSSFVPHSWAFPLASTPLTPLRSWVVKQPGLEHLFGSCWGAWPGGSRKQVSCSCRFQSALSTQLQKEASTCALLRNGVQSSHRPPVSLTIPPTSQGGLPSLCPNTGLGCPVCSLNCSLPRAGLCPCILPFPLSLLLWAQVMTRSLLFPSYPIPCGSYL